MQNQSNKENQNPQDSQVKSKWALQEEVEYMKKHPLSWEEMKSQALKLKTNRENEEKKS